ncbi:homeobox-leucine zipper protein ATHB-15 [Canna indica]|uniref:Homeobox-leucine zipper protein ATHB-15 n=1 Tax=Canna indica TaxID=4628 RepID=A0AAQ3JNH6_9LILI|nr:homeobox-leucine zipper protein ATHB-15 [Canna indica]
MGRSNIDAYSAAAVKATPWTLATSCSGCTGGQVILPLAHTLGHEEVFKLEGIGHNQDTLTSRDLYLLQDLYSSEQAGYRI